MLSTSEYKLTAAAAPQGKGKATLGRVTSSVAALADSTAIYLLQRRIVRCETATHFPSQYTLHSLIATHHQKLL